MMLNIAESLFGSKAKVRFLLLTALILLFSFLGGKEIWTQEHRWAEIVMTMFDRQDFFHPYLGEQNYYDKPLMSYWLIALFSYLTGHLNNLELRIPSALAGLLAVYAIYQIGCILKNKSVGLLAGWLLLSTYYFVFWARVSSADMLNMGLILFAIAWFLSSHHQQKFLNYLIFFAVLAIASLCKGLVACVLVFLAVSVYLVLHGSFKRHFNLKMLVAFSVGITIYLTPFILSDWLNNGAYQQSGLYLVYQENILRFFKPFDHRGPIYTYFIYLPIYLLPWSILIIPALYQNMRYLRNLSLNEKWLMCVFILFFAFFTLSGSRRSYYVLPIVPFAVLLIANWLDEHLTLFSKNNLAFMIVSIILLWFCVIDYLPSWFYTYYGTNAFAKKLESSLKQDREFELVLLDAESKLNFYLHRLHPLTHFDMTEDGRKLLTAEKAARFWPILYTKSPNMVFISRRAYEAILTPYFKDYVVVKLNIPMLPFLERHIQNSPIAFIPVR